MCDGSSLRPPAGRHGRDDVAQIRIDKPFVVVLALRSRGEAVEIVGIEGADDGTEGRRVVEVGSRKGEYLTALRQTF